ncbi:BgTH12-00782 [Blumeria graminis f. sp. triticale]|uniref:Structure-specific endonuclease subunit SLX4 n=3 Tax=Blumeria graminis TaxID=34373 RepID=A0A061HSH7_BLUGR|nr:hypothetical protein BGT96224_3836 [Blumeria graminis f. sp. tritici 96224]CAD6505290.1 BgTH12-00782 [Blumeria graminis f. sp. triticale]VDB93302.1 Bgt-3836 [Blumeria graminis f. sp. tritici]
MAPDRSYLVMSSPPRQHEAFDLSSSPLPSLNELVNSISKDAFRGNAVSNTLDPLCRSKSMETSAPESLHMIGGSISGNDWSNIQSICGLNVEPKLPLKGFEPDDMNEEISIYHGRSKIITKTVELKVQDEFPSPGSKCLKSIQIDESGTEENPPPYENSGSGREQNLGILKDKSSSSKKAKHPKILAKKNKRKTNPKIGCNSEAKFPKGKVTKLSTSLASVPKMDQLVAGTELPVLDTSGLGLMDAVKRRRDWTPPNKPNSSFDTTEIVAKWPSSCESHKSGDKKSRFFDLFGKFAFSASDSTIDQKIAPKDRVVSKRKEIELVKTNNSSAKLSPVKKAARKKKATTITELSTSFYADTNPSESLSPKDLPVVNFPSKNIPRLKPSGKLHSKTKPKSKSKNAKIKEPSLLSPESALKEVHKQDFVFGTSSQLAMDDSSTYMRNINEAIQESNNLYDPFNSSPTATSTLEGVIAKRNLWNAASRDSAGSLLETNIVDLETLSDDVSTTSGPSFAENSEKNCFTFSSSAVPSRNTIISFENNDIEEIAPKYLQTSSPRQKLNYPDTSKNKDQINNSCKKLCSLPDSSAHRIEVEKIPNFNSYTNAQLAKEISMYHFKAIKKREQMISLLEKCWRGKQQIKMAVASTKSAMKNTTQSINIDIYQKHRIDYFTEPHESSLNSLKIPATSKFIPGQANTLNQVEKNNDVKLSLDETPTKEYGSGLTVEDSGSDIDINPYPSGQKVQPRSSISSLSQLERNNDDTDLLFSHITSAIKNTKPSDDCSNPTWYEKMLLYDPIVLEDLTVWLNTGALQETNWDGEVELKDVKKWCESKSICCLSRESLRNGTRCRY